MNSAIRAIKTTTLCSLALMAAGCASGPDLRSDYDKSADFSDYSTFNFYEDAGPGGGNYQNLFSQYVEAAITKEMELRGYTKSDNPDLLINFNAVLQEKTNVSSVPSAPMGPYGVGYYGYRGGFYDPWYGYGYGTETHVSQYTEGTFNIDLVDAEKKRLVWEAVGVGRVTDKIRDNLEATINAAVPQYFESYPFRAGSNTPVNPN